MASKLNTILFTITLLALGVFLFVFPSDSDASQYENRAMADMPDLNFEDIISGRYSNDFESFLSDSIAFRTRFLAFSASLENVYGLRMGGAIRVDIGHDDLGVGMVANPDIVYRPPPEQKPPATVKPPEAGTEPVIPENRVNPAKPFSIDLNYNPNAIMYGDFYVDGANVSRYVGVLNDYRKDLPENTRVFCLLVPTHVEFLHERYSTNAARQLPVVQMIYNSLDNDIIPVDAYGKLAERAENEYLYFRTDHHWTALGAYYAYLAFAEAAGFDPVTIENYEEHFFPDYIGSYGTGADRIIRDHPDTLYYYRIDDGTTFSQNMFFIPVNLNLLSYALFMGGDHAVLDFESSNKNGKTLIIVKDSYANAFIPWVSPSYERIVVMDPRQFKGKVSDYTKNSTEVDLLFLNSAFTPSLASYVDLIAEIK